MLLRVPTVCVFHIIEMNKMIGEIFIIISNQYNFIPFILVYQVYQCFMFM